MKNDNKYIAVYTLKLANHLVRKGYDIKSITNSDKDSYYKIILFEKSPEIEREINNYMKVR